MGWQRESERRGGKKKKKKEEKVSRKGLPLPDGFQPELSGQEGSWTEAASWQCQALAAAHTDMVYITPLPLMRDRWGDPQLGWGGSLTQNFPTSTHISAALPRTSRGRAVATLGMLLMNTNGSDGSLSLQGAVWDPATNGSRCRGRRRGEEEVSGLWWMGVSHSGDPAPPPCLSLLTGAGLPSQQGALPKKSKTLACSSEKYHCSALIQCSTHPLSPRIVRPVTGLLRPWARLSVHHRPRLRPALAAITRSPCGFQR